MTANQSDYDLVVIGGGINGAGIAADAAGRGLKVLLCEMNDLASSTSSKSSKLIHGGLRYLEYYEFRLVREALAEREVLLKKAPHIIWPLRFQLPHRPHLRPAWMIRAGLFLYDHLAKRVSLSPSRSIRFAPEGPLASHLTHGFEYSDGWVDDARLVVLNAMLARNHGATIMTRTRCTSARRGNGHWQIELENQTTQQLCSVSCKALVNAAGPWVTQLFDSALHTPSPKKIRLVKGSHIIVPKIHEGPHAYILQNEDGRVVFVLPYEEQYSLIGTTDIEHFGEPDQACISDTEIDYLISVVNEHFQHQLHREDIVSTFSGVRPLLDDEADNPQAVSRDYTFEMDSSDTSAPLLSVFGGKITTYRKLSEAAVNRICEHFPAAGPCLTAQENLPGGDIASLSTLLNQLQTAFPWLPETLAKRYARTYGTLSLQMLEGIQGIDEMGQHFGAGLYTAEVEYLKTQEWAKSTDDILWRRTKLGLQMSDEGIQMLNAHLTNEELSAC
ncbi:glycerol-3-phosphate dehydrogenase [Aestuariicella hydrocarbonica]|uniref:Glycerol-3-phosphate dehydrogenase n=1 Tax=Pseudomaricurvus hydrocarbonicus TaxID=1470433 RepID=A0A9E5JRX6_9GAMM|nr:glycerol-3-phosphate dehydrogenase [Aestuariicella hydrocarbonica]NHO64276.1 glycerol-3-phosphate dehydrogenase [Aestuariicella hydrocarbonica]